MTPTHAMRTEAKRAFSNGFALTESELRRLHDLTHQQIERMSPGTQIQTKYELKYKNGSVSYSSSIDEVLDQENFGSAAITRLRLDMSDHTESNSVRVEFTNADEEEGLSTNAITYRVSGLDRDWVFVTSSQIEERIGKVKRFAPNQLLVGKNRFGILLLPMLFVMILILVAQLPLERKREAGADAQLASLEQAWKSGTLKDPTEAVLRVAHLLVNVNRDSGNESYWMPVAAFGACFALVGLTYLYFHFNPLYNFLWGDYVAKYEKRRSTGRFLIFGVVLVVLLGVIANLISRHIGI
jgi:hypothetical protein